MLKWRRGIETGMSDDGRARLHLALSSFRMGTGSRDKATLADTICDGNREAAIFRQRVWLTAASACFSDETRNWFDPGSAQFLRRHPCRSQAS